MVDVVCVYVGGAGAREERGFILEAQDREGSLEFALFP
jgi:hypothetical protein